MDKYDSLRLENQLCFPLYACSKEIVRRYNPILAELDLTYTQYIVMMVLWREREIGLKALGSRLFLDSGTLTPLLKKLEQKGYISRSRSPEDERNLIIHITEKGLSLREAACAVPLKMSACVSLTEEEAKTLYSLLYKILESISPE